MASTAYNAVVEYDSIDHSYSDAVIIYPLEYDGIIEYDALDYNYDNVIITYKVGYTYTWHLNRLANTIVNGVPQYEAQGAANIWAGTSGLALVGALNYIYEQRNGVNYHYDLQGILNALAGTWGLGPNEAAAEIAS